MACDNGRLFVLDCGGARREGLSLESLYALLSEKPYRSAGMGRKKREGIPGMMLPKRIRWYAHAILSDSIARVIPT